MNTVKRSLLSAFCAVLAFLLLMSSAPSVCAYNLSDVFFGWDSDDYFSNNPMRLEYQGRFYNPGDTLEINAKVGEEFSFVVHADRLLDEGYYRTMHVTDTFPWASRGFGLEKDYYTRSYYDSNNVYQKTQTVKLTCPYNGTYTGGVNLSVIYYGSFASGEEISKTFTSGNVNVKINATGGQEYFGPAEKLSVAYSSDLKLTIPDKYKDDSLYSVIWYYNDQAVGNVDTLSAESIANRGIGTYKAKVTRMADSTCTGGEGIVREYTVGKGTANFSFSAAPSMTYGTVDGNFTVNSDIPATLTVNSKSVDIAAGENKIPVSTWLSETPNAGSHSFSYTLTPKQTGLYDYYYMLPIFAYPNLPYTVTAKSISENSLTLAETEFLYDGNAHTPTATVSGLVNDSDFTLAITDSEGNAAASPVNAGTYTVTATGKGNYKDSLTASFVITPRDVTVTANDQTIFYASPIDESAYTSSGLLSGHTLKASVINANNDKNVTAGGVLRPDKTSVKITAGEEDVTGNYRINTQDGTLVIQKNESTSVAPAASSKTFTYGDEISIPDFMVSGAYDSDVKILWYNADTQTAADAKPWTSGSAPHNAGNYKISLLVEETANTSAASSEMDITISKKPLLITGMTASKIYDGTGATDVLQAINVTFDGMESIDVLAAGTDFRIVNPVLHSETGRFDAGASYSLTADIVLLDTAPARNYVLTNGTAFAGTAEILPRSIEDVTIAALEDHIYTGMAFTPDITAAWSSLPRLVKDTDYTLSYQNNINTGEAAVTVTGIHNYTGQRTIPFAIKPAALAQNWLKTSYDAENPYVYNSKKQVPTLTITVDSFGTLVADKDYTVSYTRAGTEVDAPTAAGSYTLKVTGQGNFTGELSAAFSIEPFAVTVTPDANQGKTYSQAEPALTYRLDKSLPNGESLTAPLIRTSGENAGTYTISLAAASKNPNYTIQLASGTHSFVITPLEITTANTAITAPDLIHNGKEQTLTPTMVVTLLTEGKTETLDSSDFTISKQKAAAVGTYTMTVTGKGNFSGTLRVQRKIVPDPAVLEDVLDGTITPDTVSVTQKEDLEKLKAALDSVTANTNATSEEKQDWADAAEKLPALQNKVNELSKALNTAAVQEARKTTPQNVKVAQKKTLETAKKDIQAYLYANANNITSSEKAALEDQISNIDTCLEAIGTAEPMIKKASEWIAKNAAKADADELKMREELKALQDEISKLPKNTRRIVNDAVKKDLDAVEKKLYTYKVSAVSTNKWTRKSSKDLAFKANGDISLFDKAMVDGKKISRLYYYLEDGSTLITLKSSYLSGLKVGKHTLQVVYQDGSTNELTFHIKASSNNPRTGDQIMAAVAIMGLSGAALVTLVVIRKKKKK